MLQQSSALLSARKTGRTMRVPVSGPTQQGNAAAVQIVHEAGVRPPFDLLVHRHAIVQAGSRVRITRKSGGMITTS
jgi:hypothetical protein